MISIVTIAVLLLADVLALVFYPFWAWRNPFEASNSHSLVEVMGWSWLVDIVNPEKGGRNSVLVRFFQAIMRPIDALVVDFWNSLFMRFAPIGKRKYFIDTLGNNLQSLSRKSQKKYFEAVGFERKVYLIKNNMLSQEIFPDLYKINKDAFLEAGRLSDEQFMALSSAGTELFCAKFDLNLEKQKMLILHTIESPYYYGPSLREYIMRRGLHPAAVSYFYNSVDLSDSNLDVELKNVPKFLEFRQDVVTVRQTSGGSERDIFAFSKYLETRKQLGYSAQVEMNSWQYKIFHKAGLQMLSEAIYAKIVLAGKTQDGEKFVSLMMEYGEVENNKTAMQQIAGNERLNSLWLNHLVEKEKTA